MNVLIFTLLQCIAQLIVNNFLINFVSNKEEGLIWIPSNVWNIISREIVQYLYNVTPRVITPPSRLPGNCRCLIVTPCVSTEAPILPFLQTLISHRAMRDYLFQLLFNLKPMWKKKSTLLPSWKSELDSTGAGAPHVLCTGIPELLS